MFLTLHRRLTLGKISLNMHKEMLYQLFIHLSKVWWLVRKQRRLIFALHSVNEALDAITDAILEEDYRLFL